MRMRDLEQRSGVGRETIRFYIREGLLPEPERMGRNSARYNDQHVIALTAIKRLQEERYLPLSVIKAILNADDTRAEYEAVGPIAAQLPSLEADLHARLAARLRPDETPESLCARLDVPVEMIDDLVRVGMVRAAMGADGQRTILGEDIAIAEICIAMHASGFTPERGFTADTWHFYLEFVDWLASEEIKLFTRHIDPKADEDLAGRAERGIALGNEMLGLLRTRALLARLHGLTEHTPTPRPSQRRDV